MIAPKARFLFPTLSLTACAVLGGVWWQQSLPDSTRKSPVVAKRAEAATSRPIQAATPALGVETGKSDAALTAFDAWAQRHQAASATERKAMRAEGMALAGARRAALVKLIRENPAQALAAAVPMTVRRELPSGVQELLEERVSGKGELALLAATPMLGKTVAQPKFRHALVNGREYEAFTYGKRAKATTLTDVSINGIALDGLLAVNDSPVRVLEAGEMADGREVDAVCPTDGLKTPLPAADEPFNVVERTAVEIDGRICVFCNPAQLRSFESAHPGDEVVAANGDAGTSTVTGRPPYAWTHGTKKVLLIRVDFSDKTGTPINTFDSQLLTPSYMVNLFNDANGIRDFYEQCSYGQASLDISESTDVTGLLRMPATGASYALNNRSSLLHSDARALAQAAGFAVDSYDRIGVVFADLDSVVGDPANNQFTWAGLGSLVGKNFWVQSQFTFSVVAHEIGHNYGLNHGSRWSVTDGNPVSSTGTKVEYGDPFDVMGGGNDITEQFNPWNKSILQWLPDAAVNTVTSAGTYRVYRFDDAAASLANTQALKVVRNQDQDYWISYRRATANASLDNGAYIIWGGNSNDNGVLLDMTTPGTNSTNDAALAVGATFNDSAAGITLNPVAKGGSGADEWLDVQVTFQPRITWEKSAYDVDEASGMASLTVKRANSSTGAVSVHWATANGTATSPADYTASSGDVTWASGDMADKVIQIPVVADAVVDSSETFSVTLSSLTGGVLPNGAVATVTLIEAGVNDPGFEVEFMNSTVQKVLPLPDGSSIIGGNFDQFQDAGFTIYNNRGGIGRVRSNGTIDTDWATGGGSGGSGGVFELARQPDGKILVAGDFTSMHGVARNRIARLNVDGSLDSSFNPGSAANGRVSAVLVQPDGKIVIGGRFTSYNGTAREYLARLNANGSLDTTFVGPEFGGDTGWRVNALAMQPDGMILAAGSFYFSSGGLSGGLCRVTTTGVRDAAFNGMTTGSQDLVGGVIRDVNAVAVQQDGKILVAGNFTAFNGVARGHVARLSATGALDATFAPTSNDDVNTLLVQNDGMIVVGGDFTTFNGSARERIVRLETSGSTDLDFGAAGGFDDSVLSLAMQADGKILAAVNYANFQGNMGVYGGGAPLWRMFSGLPTLPGTLQLTAGSFAATEGQNAVLTVSRIGGAGGAMSVNYAAVVGSADAADFTAASGTLTWANGDAANKTITIPITSDALVESGESFTVNLGQALVGGAILGVSQTAAVEISDPGAPVGAYATWRASQFTTPELADSEISGDLADPDKDGVVNLLEFAFGLLAKTSDAPGLPSSSLVSVLSDDYLALTFRRQINAPEISYIVETNAVLSGAWAANAVQVGSAVPNGDGTETVTFRDTLPLDNHPERFMRVRVVLAP
ncbi:MAG: Calx-beta domain-containing protein [Verrucomicrobiota bacterium]